MYNENHVVLYGKQKGINEWVVKQVANSTKGGFLKSMCVLSNIISKTCFSCRVISMCYIVLVIKAKLHRYRFVMKKKTLPYIT